MPGLPDGFPRDEADHIRFADTRFFMALYIGAMMTIDVLALQPG